MLNVGARVPICGYISNYNDEDITKAETPFHILKSLDNVPEHRFFVVYEWQDRYEEATKQLGEWVKQGVLKYKECAGEGLSQHLLYSGYAQGGKISESNSLKSVSYRGYWIG